MFALAHGKISCRINQAPLTICAPCTSFRPSWNHIKLHLTKLPILDLYYTIYIFSHILFSWGCLVFILSLQPNAVSRLASPPPPPPPPTPEIGCTIICQIWYLNLRQKTWRVVIYNLKNVFSQKLYRFLWFIFVVNLLIHTVLILKLN